MFRDRVEAGRQLADRLSDYRNDARAIVLGVPRGGVVVAAEVARALGLPLDVLVVRKIGAPGNPEFAVGAVDERGNIVLNPMVQVPEEYVRGEAERQRAEIQRRLADFRQGRPPLDLAGKTAILTDDGIATGQTMLAAVASVRAGGAEKVVVAAPVVAPDSATRLRQTADDLVDISEPRFFAAVGEFYASFPQIEDDEVVTLLEQVWAAAAGRG